jgi:hypothetical protein
LINSILEDLRGCLVVAGTALGLDLGDDGKFPVTPRSGRHGGIHPRNKTEIGRRLALSYAKVGLGLDVVAEGPVFQAASITGSTVSVSFTNTGGADGLALSPTAQCNTHNKLGASPADCCSATPRMQTKGTNLPEDAGVPFELELAVIIHATLSFSIGFRIGCRAMFSQT